MFVRETEEVYRELWLSAEESFSQGEVKVDPNLVGLYADLRRGITLIARPSSACIQQFTRLLAALKEILPGQYFYDPCDLHVTVLTLIDAHEGFRLDEVPIALYDQVMDDVLSHFAPFDILFRGITATASTIMVQGHLRTNDLNEIRAALRVELDRAGLADSLDRRYRNVTAHSVVARFKKPPRNPRASFEKLRAWRDIDFGLTTVNTLYFVQNDWYMSHAKIRILREYELGGHPAHSSAGA
jgi:2'-5' RNA ligase